MRVILIIYQHFLPTFRQVVDLESIESVVFICDEFIKPVSYFFGISKVSDGQDVLRRLEPIIIIGVSERPKLMEVKCWGTKESNQVPIICP